MDLSRKEPRLLGERVGELWVVGDLRGLALAAQFRGGEDVDCICAGLTAVNAWTFARKPANTQLRNAALNPKPGSFENSRRSKVRQT